MIKIKSVIISKYFHFFKKDTKAQIKIIKFWDTYGLVEMHVLQTHMFVKYVI